MIRYKDFEIRPVTALDGHQTPGRFEVIKWYKTDEPIEVTSASTGQKMLKDTFFYVVAFIEWNKKEPCWEFRSVGTRFLEDYTEGLCEYIMQFLKLFDICRRDDDGC